ncbi:MAG: S8 family serine peptidase [Francisellaceae bacterium]
MKKSILSMCLVSLGLISSAAYAGSDGEISLIVKYKPQASAMNLKSSNNSTYSVIAQQDLGKDKALVTVRPENISVSTLTLAPAVSAKEQEEEAAYQMAREFMESNPDVIYAIPSSSTMHAYGDVSTTAATGVDVARWADQWDMHNDGNGIGVEGAWQLVNNSKTYSTYAAVVDSGLAPQAPEDITKKLEVSATHYFYTDSNNKVVVSDNITDNGSYHGTHVAGTIAADGPNVTGVAGPVDAVKVIPVRALGDDGSGSTDAILDAVQWAAGSAVDGVASNPYPAKVVNLSLGMSKPWYISDNSWKNNYMTTLCAAWGDTINAVNGKGAVVVIAAGNDSQTLFNDIPSGCQNINAVVVEASGSTGKLSFYSTYDDPASWKVGSLVVRAPGGDSKIGGDAGEILSTMNGGYGYMQGTSMATPHVVGIVSLIYALNPDADVDYVRDILKHSAQSNGVLSAQLAVGNVLNSKIAAA